MPAPLMCTAMQWIVQQHQLVRYRKFDLKVVYLFCYLSNQNIFSKLLMLLKFKTSILWQCTTCCSLLPERIAYPHDDIQKWIWRMGLFVAAKCDKDKRAEQFTVGVRLTFEKYSYYIYHNFDYVVAVYWNCVIFSHHFYCWFNDYIDLFKCICI